MEFGCASRRGQTKFYSHQSSYSIFVRIMPEVINPNTLCFQKSMEALGFSHEMLSNVFKIVSTILKLGNLIFVSVTNIDGTEGCAISNELGAFGVRDLQ